VEFLVFVLEMSQMVQLQQHLKQLKVNKKLNISEYPILGNLVISDKFNISAGTKKR
jgi:hypothetical protein